MAMHHYLYVVTLEILILAFFPSLPCPRPAWQHFTHDAMAWLRHKQLISTVHTEYVDFVPAIDREMITAMARDTGTA